MTTPPHDSDDPVIIADHLPERDFLGQGRCMGPREQGLPIDTIILHSCYIGAEFSAVSGVPPVKRGEERVARELAAQWCSLKDATDPADLRMRQQRRGQAVHALILARRGVQGFAHFNKASIKDVFELLGISAHYLIDRDGAIFEFVPPELKAFHCGPSKMPRAEDAREFVNSFSIGIELFATEDSGYTEKQYEALGKLVGSLVKRFPIRNLYGHCHISIGRKGDPYRFDWVQFRDRMGPALGAINYPEMHAPEGC